MATPRQSGNQAAAHRQPACQPVHARSRRHAKVYRHGGPTPTYQIGAAAVATGGDAAACARDAGGVDRRGYLRPPNMCALGAYDPHATKPASLVADMASSSPEAGSQATGCGMSALAAPASASASLVLLLGAAMLLAGRRRRTRSSDQPARSWTRRPLDAGAAFAACTESCSRPIGTPAADALTAGSVGSGRHRTTKSGVDQYPGFWSRMSHRRCTRSSCRPPGGRAAHGGARHRRDQTL